MTKAWYLVAPGVTWVNGVAAPDTGRVQLSISEAAFDLGLGRIAPEGMAEEAPQLVPDVAPPKPRRRGRQP